MSHLDPPARKYELVDADETVIYHGGINDNNAPTRSSNNNHDDLQLPPPSTTFPSDQIIDGRSSLQVYDTLIGHNGAVIVTNPVTEEEASQAAASAPTGSHQVTATTATAHPQDPPPPPPTLPNGEIIDAKNINQSYDYIAQRSSSNNVNVTTMTNVGMDIVNRANSHSDTNVSIRAARNNDNDGRNNCNEPTVHAVAVDSLVVVDAEPILTLPQPIRQRRAPTFSIVNSLVIVILVVAVAVSVYCGTGNCNSTSSTNSKDGSPIGIPTVVTSPTLDRIYNTGMLNCGLDDVTVKKGSDLPTGFSIDLVCVSGCCVFNFPPFSVTFS
jgi:hypothetical protein